MMQIDQMRKENSSFAQFPIMANQGRTTWQRGECDMRIGSTIILIIVIFIAFGYAISDDIQVRNDLKDARQQLNSCQGAVLNGQQIIDDLENKNASLTDVVAEQDDEIATVRSENDRLRGANDVLRQENHALQQENRDLVSQPRGDPLIENDQMVLAGIVIAQTLITIFYKGRKLGLKKIRKNTKQEGEYIYLTPGERELLISLRRNRK
jgi:septal ring factor EnvC (AmiA/AmiB activator)